MSVLREEFCDHADSLVVYESEGTVFAFAFRSAVSADEDAAFLGKTSFARVAMSDKEVVEKATALRSTYSHENALAAIVSKHSSYAGLVPEQTEVKQLGDFTRAAFVFTVDGFRNRFLVGGAPSGSYEIIEECRLEKSKEVYTETKVSVTGETSIATNDVVRVVKEDQTAKEVIENIRREVAEVRAQEPTAIKITDYEKKIEFVVDFEKLSEEQTLTRQEVLVVHDKVSHNNEVVSVEQVRRTETTAQEPVPEKFVVVAGVTAEVPKQVHEAISVVTEHVRQSENAAPEEIVVRQTLVREHAEPSKVEKVQQVVENTKTGEQLLVSAVVNVDSKKVIVEDVKPIEEHVVKHLETF